ncbi:MAG TPA: nitroreductase family deazaflavin-dependent oxidoreductase [Iamia sp.]|jgi:deazaflavin-dependent oxidoreductase (nitroreductase family)|nr:nitroreductase family deazaflavin-dependent oxidoreductase [Iamia sp.]
MSGADATAVTPVADRPPRALRIANRMLPRMIIRGKGPSFLHLVTVAGRRRGEPHTTPLAAVEEDGHVWLVSAYGDVAWVRNVRAAGELELARGADQVRYAAHELDGPDAVPVLRTYLSMPSERFVRSHFAVDADSTTEAILAEAPRHPVFALTPVP